MTDNQLYPPASFGYHPQTCRNYAIVNDFSSPTELAGPNVANQSNVAICYDFEGDELGMSTADNQFNTTMYKLCDWQQIRVLSRATCRQNWRQFRMVL